MHDLSEDLSTLLTSGGDDRQIPDPQTGLTRYRTTAGPRAGTPFGSCTASWPSETSFADAQRTLDRWRAHATVDDALHATADDIRHRIRRVLDVPAGAEVALTPSGTDAVYLVSALALGGAHHVHHVVVGASELGGGTVRAARGEHFNARTPHGPTVSVGDPVVGLAGRCSAEPLYVRGDRGERLSLDRIDHRVHERVERALEQHDRVVLHLVAHSKTGLRAPSLEPARLLARRHPDRVTVLVDAAQGRLAPHDMRNALEEGFIVLFTGSKFYSGPPFSGALLVPEVTDPGALPLALGAWLARSDLPPAWTAARASLSTPHNPGLLLRWVAALAEIEPYHAIPPSQRGRVYHTFAGAVLEQLGPSSTVTIEDPMPPVHLLVTGLGAYPSVFSFSVRDGDHLLGSAALRRLHAAIDSGDDPFHLGQPVALGPPDPTGPAYLRVALGARLITELANTPDAGGALLRAQLGRLRARIEALVAKGVHRPDAVAP